MTLNLWNFTAEVKKFGSTRGTVDGAPANWGKLWILAKLDDVIIPEIGSTGFQQVNNTIFLHAELDYSADGVKNRSSAAVLSQLKEGAFLFVKEAKIAEIQRSKQKEDKTWEQFKEIGLKASVMDIQIAQTRFPMLNLGLVHGKVVGQNLNTIVVEDTYTIPNRGRHTRRVPLMLSSDYERQLVGKYPFITAQLCGKNAKGEDKVFGIVKTLIV